MKTVHNDMTGIDENIFSISTSTLREKLEQTLDRHVEEYYRSHPTAMLLGALSRLEDGVDGQLAVVESLNVLNTALQEEIPLNIRPRVLERINHVAETLKRIFKNDTAIFRAMFTAYSAAKAQLDHNPHIDTDESQREWKSLEEGVYLFCDWEDAAETIVAHA